MGSVPSSAADSLQGSWAHLRSGIRISAPVLTWSVSPISTGALDLASTGEATSIDFLITPLARHIYRRTWELGDAVLGKGTCLCGIRPWSCLLAALAESTLSCLQFQGKRCGSRGPFPPQYSLPSCSLSNQSFCFVSLTVSPFLPAPRVPLLLLPLVASRCFPPFEYPGSDAFSI